MSERELLSEWMQRQGISAKMLAKTVDMDYTYITRMLSGERNISDSLRWRFAARYGMPTALRVFNDEGSEEREPAV